MTFAAPELVAQGGVDVTTLIGAIVALLTVVLGAMGAACKVFVTHMAAEAERQREHEEAMSARWVEASAKFDEAVDGFREDNRYHIQSIFELQHKTVEAMSSLAAQVGKLSMALEQLRTRMDRMAPVGEAERGRTAEDGLRPPTRKDPF